MQGVCMEPVYRLQLYFQFGVFEMCRTIGSQLRAICRAGSRCRGCNSTSDLEMKNRVVGASVGRQRRVMLRPLSHRRVRGCNYTSNLDSLRCVGL